MIRKSLTATSEDADVLLRGEIEADEAYFGGRRACPWVSTPASNSPGLIHEPEIFRVDRLILSLVFPKEPINQRNPIFYPLLSLFLWI